MCWLGNLEEIDDLPLLKYIEWKKPKHVYKKGEITKQLRMCAIENKSTKQGIHGLVESETAGTGPAWVCTRSSAYML